AAVFPHAEIVTVKRALSTRAAVHSHPEIVHKALREAARRALLNPLCRPLSLPGPFAVQLSTVRTYHADLFAAMPGVERLSPVCVGFTAATPLDVCRTLNTFSAMAASVA
ncbi:M55 family metallopeptidase, partial [uncultured Bilophila sp.]